MIDNAVKRGEIITLLGVLAALVSLHSLLLNSAYAQESAGIPLEQINSAVQAELEDDANDISGTAILLVYSDTEWTGSIIGSDLSSSSSSGSRDEKIQFTCEGVVGRFSASFQKQTDDGYLALAVIQNRNVLNTTSTVSPLGIASTGGLCNDAGDGSSITVRDSACLIATAAFGSDLAPQVQFLRGFRDNHIQSTAAGGSFMNAFNAVYYSFSPQVADYERGQPWLQQAVRIAIYPLLGILTLSEKAYFAGEGEYGAVAAGLAASAMIGTVYLAPLAFSIGRVRERKLNYRALGLIGAGISAALVISLSAEDTFAMMFTTSALVLSVSAISALVVADLLRRALRRFPA